MKYDIKIWQLFIFPILPLVINMWIRSNLEFTFLFWSVSAPTCRVLRHRSTAGASDFPRHLPNIWNSAKMVIEWDCENGDWDYIILHYPNMWQASTFNNHWTNRSQPSTARTKLSNESVVFVCSCATASRKGGFTPKAAGGEVLKNEKYLNDIQWPAK